MNELKPRVTDAELIEALNEWESVLRAIDDDMAEKMAKAAERLEQLTKPDPWRSLSESFAEHEDVWLRVRTGDELKVILGYQDSHGQWLEVTKQGDYPIVGEVTGWKPVIAPEP